MASRSEVIETTVDKVADPRPVIGIWRMSVFWLSLTDQCC
jgi:hypothetical protein